MAMPLNEPRNDDPRKLRALLDKVVNLAYEALTAEGGGHTGRYRAPDRDDDIFDDEDVKAYGSDWAEEKWCECNLCEYEMPIGKYKYESIEWIWFNDPQYVQWCIREFEADSYVRRRLILMIEHKGVDWMSWPQGRRAR